MSGLTLIEILAILFCFEAIKFIFSISSKDSTLKNNIPYFKDSAISSSLLATPEKTIFDGSAFILLSLSSSPKDTISKPAPSSLNIFKIFRFDDALTE